MHPFGTTAGVIRVKHPLSIFDHFYITVCTGTFLYLLRQRGNAVFATEKLVIENENIVDITTDVKIRLVHD